MDLKLFNIPTEDLYKDLFQPGMKKAGEALSTVMDASNLILLPLKLLNERSKIYLENNLKRYSEKVNKSDLTITQVPQHIGLPIVEKLTYLEQNELSEAFLNLLNKASFEESAKLAHPVFVTILNNLSVDEAKILFKYKDTKRIPYIDIYIHKYKDSVPKPIGMDSDKVKTLEEMHMMIDYTFQDRDDVYLKYAWNLTGIEKEVDLLFPDNIDVYIDNLLHNGLIYSHKDSVDISDLQRYELLQTEFYKVQFDLLRERLENIADVDYKLDVDLRRCSFMFTDLGNAFLKACITE